MTTPPNFISRTEDIKQEDILSLYVRTPQDQKIVEQLKSATPIVLEGSRGTGKTFVLRVAQAQLLESLAEDRVLPVYVSFAKSSLLQSGDPNQFLHWMMSRLCSRILRALYRAGYLVNATPAIKTLTGGQISCDWAETPLEKLAKEYEETYKRPGSAVDNSGIPQLEDFKDAIEDICRGKKIVRLAIFFDEAAHIFRPEQQRQFFTLFRDLRSPFLTCNAAVYPGVTFYGPTFQPYHDATIFTLIRDPLNRDYLKGMTDIVMSQADSDLSARIMRNGENFKALAYAVSGNPRLLFKTIGIAPKLNRSEVTNILKEFYRTDIWAEHSALADKYSGHRSLIDWGREFIENSVIPESNTKNEQWKQEEKPLSTCFFWIHRDAPAAIFEALRILSYIGIVTRLDSYSVATRGQIGTRYAVNLGCLAAPSPEPVPFLTHCGRTLSLKRFTEYGANSPWFSRLTSTVGDFQETDVSPSLDRELQKAIDVLDLTAFQKEGLRAIGLDTVGKALQASEADFQKIDYVGPKRSRKIMNVVTASVLEYLSG